MNEAPKESQMVGMVQEPVFPRVGDSYPGRSRIHHAYGATDLGVLGDLPLGVRPGTERRQKRRRKSDRSTHYVNDGSPAAGGNKEKGPGRLRQRYNQFGVAHAHMISHSIGCLVLTALTYVG